MSCIKADSTQCKSNDLVKYCACKSTMKTVLYNKLKTGVNDPSITKRMRYSHIINSRQSSANTNNYSFFQYR